jgi:hypothetical protein
MKQETPRKHTKPTYTEKVPKGRPKARWTDAVQNDIREMSIVSWRKVAVGRDGWRGGTGEGLVLLGSGDTEEEEEEEGGGRGGRGEEKVKKKKEEEKKKKEKKEKKKKKKKKKKRQRRRRRR